MKTFFLLTLSILTAFPAAAFAMPPVRCAGRVQFAPCAAGLDLPAAAPERRSRSIAVSRDVPRAKPQPVFFGRIVTSALQRLPSGDGIWRGRLEGNGLIELELQILRRGIIESTRRLGRVKLSNKSSSFVVKSRLPSGAEWSWNLLANANAPQAE